MNLPRIIRLILPSAAVAVLLAAAASADLNLIDGGWSVPAKLSADQKTINWSYAFASERGEEFSISHSLPADMTQYGGFLARVYLDSPSDTAFKIRFREKDGDTWEWAWGPNSAKQGWNEIRVGDFLTKGSGPWPWDSGDHKRDYKNMDKVQLFLTDEPNRRKVGAGTIQISDFRFISVDEANVIAEQQAMEKSKALDAMVDMKTICSLESADYWSGPRRDDLSVSSDCAEGKGSLQLNLSAEPHEHFRFERNLVRGNEPVEKDLSDVRSISFAWKGDLKGCSGGCFRIWDRAGGWLEWPVRFAESGDWTRATLTVPTDSARLINLKRIGGFNWEIRAGDKALSGKLLLDDLQFSDKSVPGGRPTNKPIAPISSGGIAPLPVSNPIAAPPVHIIALLTHVSYALQEGKSDLAIDRLKTALEQYKGVPNLEFSFGPELPRFYKQLGEPKFTDTLLTVAKWCEANGVRFYIQAGGPNGIAVPYEPTKAAMDAAPTCCQGIYIGETPIEDYKGGIDQLVAMLDLVRERRKHLLYHRFTNYWWKMGLGKENLDRAFAPRFADTFVPLWENLEPSCEGLTLGSVLGLWLSGRAHQWGVSTQSFWWDNMKLGGVVDMPAHNWMRMFVSAVGLGATYVQVEPEWSMQGECLKALQRFGKLLTTGAISPSPGPADTVGIPPVALQMRQSDATESHAMLNWAAWNPIDRSRQTPAGDLFRAICHSAHFYEQLMPENPLGLVAILPQGRAPRSLDLIQTDGSRAMDKGQWLPESESLPYIASKYTQASKQMPLQADGCYFSAVRLGRGDYLAYMIDPEERFPTGVRTNLSVRIAQPWTVYDAITGEELPAHGSMVSITIPAGGFRLARVVQRQ